MEITSRGREPDSFRKERELTVEKYASSDGEGAVEEGSESGAQHPMPLGDSNDDNDNEDDGQQPGDGEGRQGGFKKLSGIWGARLPSGSNNSDSNATQSSLISGVSKNGDRERERQDHNATHEKIGARGREDDEDCHAIPSRHDQSTQHHRPIALPASTPASFGEELWSPLTPLLYASDNPQVQGADLYYNLTTGTADFTDSPASPSGWSFDQPATCIPVASEARIGPREMLKALGRAPLRPFGSQQLPMNRGSGTWSRPNFSSVSRSTISDRPSTGKSAGGIGVPFHFDSLHAHVLATKVYIQVLLGRCLVAFRSGVPVADLAHYKAQRLKYAARRAHGASKGIEHEIGEKTMARCSLYIAMTEVLYSSDSVFKSDFRALKWFNLTLRYQNTQEADLARDWIRVLNTSERKHRRECSKRSDSRPSTSESGLSGTWKWLSRFPYSSRSPTPGQAEVNASYSRALQRKPGQLSSRDTPQSSSTVSNRSLILRSGPVGVWNLSDSPKIDSQETRHLYQSGSEPTNAEDAAVASPSVATGFANFQSWAKTSEQPRPSTSGSFVQSLSPRLARWLGFQDTRATSHSDHEATDNDRPWTAESAKPRSLSITSKFAGEDSEGVGEAVRRRRSTVSALLPPLLRPHQGLRSEEALAEEGESPNCPAQPPTQLPGRPPVGETF